MPETTDNAPAQEPARVNVPIKAEHRKEIEQRNATIQHLNTEAARLIAQARHTQQLAHYCGEALNAFLDQEYHLSAIGGAWQLDVARGLLSQIEATDPK